MIYEDKEITDSREIIEVQKHFYEQLYDVDDEVSFNLTNSFGIKVPHEIRSAQQQQIGLEDMTIAIKTMSNNKTPGEDGLPIEFYKIFWVEIKDVFLEAILYAYDEKKLFSSARKGILNLIPKANKDTRLVKNLRPITLLNTDYKIIEKVIANKMVPALEHIISSDQRGFMKDRRISVNIRKMLDIIHETKVQDLEAVVMSLDFVKCFDKCSFSILHGSLNFFDFGQIVKEWTKILYDDFTVRVQNNGNFSAAISIKKGVHQGGCCSSIYFLVIAEILALSLRANEQIEGITIRDIRNILNQFADDMDIFSLCKEASIKAIYQELENFYKQSGFTVSYDKTTMYRIGSLRHSNAIMYELDQFIWSNEDIEVLGVKIAHEDILYKNYCTITDKAKEILGAWSNRGLSLLGKVQVVNTLVASLYVYKMMVLPMVPDNIIKNTYNLIRNFLWNGKKAKIALNILQNPVKSGGLNLVNLRNREMALKATWPQILHQEAEYANMVYGTLGVSNLGEIIWKCSLLPEDVKFLRVNEPFWADVLKAWAHYNSLANFSIENQIIWYNSRLRIKGKPFFWRDTYLRNLLYVYQLFEDGRYKTDEKVWEEFGLTKLRFNSLKTILPRGWKDCFCKLTTGVFKPVKPHNFEYSIVGVKNLSSIIYKFLAEDATIMQNKLVKWERELGDDFSVDIFEFGRLCNDAYKLTLVPKYRSFQYRLLQRGVVTNMHLHKWGILPSDMCSFCSMEQETICHIMFQCVEVQSLWKQFSEYIEEQYGVKVKLDLTSVILNQVIEPRRSVINFLCLLTKHFIYVQRCLKNSLSFVVLKQIIKKIESIEKYIAIKKGKIQIHNRKWRNVQNVNQQELDIEQFVMRYVNNL